ncbi:MAG: hypothetical protein CM15mP120_08770 [Pseudomonadota bacterium]|nr:MAG: hypothetical protein CM15mP120_08770 [Pseudomonadota bacterium]
MYSPAPSSKPVAKIKWWLRAAGVISELGAEVNGFKGRRSRNYSEWGGLAEQRWYRKIHLWAPPDSVSF